MNAFAGAAALLAGGVNDHAFPAACVEVGRLAHAHVLRRYDASACAREYYDALLGDSA